MDIPKVLPANADDNQKAGVRAFTIACIIVVFVVLLFRTMGRYCLKLKYRCENVLSISFMHFLGMDDLFNLLAVLTFWGFTVAVLIAIDRGMGVHIAVVLYRQGHAGLDQYNLAIYISALFYNTTLGMTKLSVLSLYRRILAGTPSRTLPLLNRAATALVALTTSANICIAAFQCAPVAAAFTHRHHRAPRSRCIDRTAFWLGSAAAGIATDAVVYGLAVAIVQPLRMAPRRKLRTLLTLLVGLLAVVASCVRLAFLSALLADAGADATFAMAVPMAWSVAEPTVGIVASSMPAVCAVRYLWSPEMKQASSSSSSAAAAAAAGGSGVGEPRFEGHAQSRGGNGPRGGGLRIGSDVECDAESLKDGGSEERLVEGRGRGRGRGYQ